jgi:hypothetical protein
MHLVIHNAFPMHFHRFPVNLQCIFRDFCASWVSCEFSCVHESPFMNIGMHLHAPVYSYAFSWISGRPVYSRALHMSAFIA